MGILDLLKGAMGGKKKAAPAGPADLLGGMLGGAAGGNPLLKMLLPVLMGGAGAGALGKLGGLGGLLGKFSGAGMDHKVKSWVGTGANEELSADEVDKALGPDILGDMAKESGMPVSAVSGGLAKMLPGLVDQLTPKGAMPDASQLGGLMKGLDIGKLLK